jgi:uncharacterized protein (UPF0332 family)
MEKQLFRPSINRSYYAMYYAVLALLAIEKKETSKHSGVISLFDKEFIKKGTFPKEPSRWFHAAFDLRQRSDYGADQAVSSSDAERMLSNAKIFVDTVSTVLQGQSDPDK